MNDTFNYFDCIYLINISTRTDKYNHSIEMFKKLGITKFKHIEPIDSTNFKKIGTITKNAQSCRESHIRCYQDAIINNYNKILIFEDDFCFNPNIENHISILIKCFDFLNNTNWDLFYFDNIVGSTKDCINNERKDFTRYESTQYFQKVDGKLFTHSYALSNRACVKIINMINTTPIIIDIDRDLLRIGELEKYICSEGIFDQLIDVKSDIIINSE